MNSSAPTERPGASQARQIALRLREQGHQAYLCGGAVRDRLLRREPKDYDVATSATPQEGRTLFPEAIPVGERFGVIVIPRPSGNVEVTSFRSDGPYADGRRPAHVRRASLDEDARRRDFTVNALYEDPVSGALVDPLGAAADLQARILRAIGDPRERFREDRLRILRALRLAMELGFAIEPTTWRAIREMAPAVAEVSAERIREELVRLLAAGRGRGLRLLDRSGCLDVLLPELARTKGVAQPPQFHPEGDVFVHTCLVLDGAVLDREVEVDAAAFRRSLEILLWSAALHDVAKPLTQSVDPDGRIRFYHHDRIGVDVTRGILERLRTSRDVQDRTAHLVGEHMRIASTPRMRPHRLRRFLAESDIDLHLRLHEADCRASHQDLSVLAFLHQELLKSQETPLLPPPLLTGHDLLALGYPEGPRLGSILRRVRELQLDGLLADREAAVREVLQRYPPRGEGRSDESHA